jgi:hypothetical protein
MEEESAMSMRLTNRAARLGGTWREGEIPEGFVEIWQSQLLFECIPVFVAPQHSILHHFLIPEEKKKEKKKKSRHCAATSPIKPIVQL